MNYGLKKRDIDNITKALRQIPEVEKAIIFGSRAKGNHKLGSDVDLAIKGKNINYSVVSSLSYLLNEEYALPYFFDVVHYEKLTESNIIEHIDRVGEIIYDKSDKKEN